MIRVLQTRALPLGYVATHSLWLIANDLIQSVIAYSHYSDFPERAMGFEPTTFSLARRRSTTELRPHDKFNHFVKYQSIAFLSAESQNRTGDTAIFSRVLYQLSYLGSSAR